MGFYNLSKAERSLRVATITQEIETELSKGQSRKTVARLVHVIGQIVYKKGCLQTVVDHLKRWNNQELVREAPFRKSLMSNGTGTLPS